MTGAGALKSVQIPHDHLKRVLSKFIHGHSMAAINGCRRRGARLSPPAPGFLKPVQGPRGVGSSDRRCRWATAVTNFPRLCPHWSISFLTLVLGFV